MAVGEALSESPTPCQYWEKVKTRKFPDFQSSLNWGQLKLESLDGKKYATDCANTEGILRIVQSIPSPKVLIKLGRPITSKENYLKNNKRKLMK